MPLSPAGSTPSTGNTLTVADVGRNASTESAKFQTAERIKSGIKEASDVVALPNGKLLVVGDTADKIGLVDTDGSMKKVKLPGLPNNKPSQMEGAAYDPSKHTLVVSREESRELWRYNWDSDKKKDPELDKKIDLSHLGGPKNKGVEGLAYLPGAQSPWGRPVMLGVKEGHPKMLLMFDAGGSKSYTTIKLDPNIPDLCKDFSAVTVDPKTGHLYISSDASALIIEVALKGQGQNVSAQLMREPFTIDDEKGKPLQRIEGLTFNADGDLYVLTENDGELLRLARK